MLNGNIFLEVGLNFDVQKTFLKFRLSLTVENNAN